MPMLSHSQQGMPSSRREGSWGLQRTFREVWINTWFNLVLHPPFSRRYFPSQLARFLAKVASFLTFTGERLGIPALLNVIIYNFCCFMQAYLNFESVKLIKHSSWLCIATTLPHDCDSTSKGLLECRCHGLCMMLGESGSLLWGQLGARGVPWSFFWLGTSSSPGMASCTSAQLGPGTRKLTHKPQNICKIFSKEDI